MEHEMVRLELSIPEDPEINRLVNNAKKHISNFYEVKVKILFFDPRIAPLR